MAFNLFYVKADPKASENDRLTTVRSYLMTFDFCLLGNIYIYTRWAHLPMSSRLWVNNVQMYDDTST